jgi:GntR family transcriptional regulator, transcriptional repressor for pyruvate dehydrogenase complex
MRKRRYNKSDIFITFRLLSLYFKDKQLKKFKLTKLRPVENLTQVDKIEIALQEFFKTESFAPGDPIPKETELAEAMGVSRTAIREAISRFKILGIIESRKNRGMIITRPDVLENMQRVMHPSLLDGETMKEIFEMRLVIEIGLADILFVRKTDVSLAKLEEIVEKEEKTANGIERLKYDIEFHSMLYEIAQNSTIHRFQKMLLPVFDYVYSGLRLKHNGSASVIKNEKYASHRDLLNILKTGDAEQFRSKMRAHLFMYFERI